MKRLAVLGLCVVLAGCAGKPGTVVIPDEGPARLQSARQLAAEAERVQKAGKSDKAIELYRKSLEQSQDLASVWNNYGLLLMQKGNYLDAAQAFDSAANLSPQDPRPYYNIAVIYHKRGWLEQALAYYTKSLERDPRFLDSLRGSVAVGKRLVLNDETALNRARLAVMIDTDPKWRQIEETEQLRIESEIKTKHGG